MEDYEGMAPAHLGQRPSSRRRGHRWLLMGGLAFAFMLVLGVGAILGSLTSTTQAASIAPRNANSDQTLTFTQGGNNSAQAVTQGDNNSAQALAATPGAHGQCEALTVSSVNGNTIVAKTSSGRSVTVHTTASTRYTQGGKTVAASAIKVGTRINVMGTHNSDGSIAATSIDIG